MARPSTVSSAYYAPLDLILGSPLKVRVLRVLDSAGEVRTATDLARQTRSNLSAVLRAIASLVDSRLVRKTGGQRGAVYGIDTHHPLAAALRALFAVERARREAIWRRISAWAETAEPKPEAVWLFGSVARRTDTFDSDVDIAVIAPGSASGPPTVRDSMLERGDAMGLAAELDEVAIEHSLAANVIDFRPHELLALEKHRPELWKALLHESEPLYGPAAAVLVRRYKREATPTGSVK